MSAAARALAVLGVLLTAAPARAQEKVLVRRFSDVVAVRTAPGEREQVLYHFAPTIELLTGGHLEQGSGGHSELYLTGGAKVSMRASGHFVLDSLAPEGDVVRFPKLTMLEVRGSLRPLILKLPGGVRCELLETSLLVEVLPSRLRIRNQVGQDVRVIGPVPEAAEGQGAGGVIELQPGQEVGFPLFDVPVVEQDSTLTWGRVAVRYAPGVLLGVSGDQLRVERQSEGELHAEAPVSVGGVATRPGAGRLVIHNPSHDALAEAAAQAAAELAAEAAADAAARAAEEAAAEAADEAAPTEPGEPAPDPAPEDTPTETPR